MKFMIYAFTFFVTIAITYAQSRELASISQDPLIQFCRGSAQHTISELQQIYFKKAVERFNAVLANAPHEELTKIPTIMELREKIAHLHESIQNELYLQSTLVTKKPEGWNQSLLDSTNRESVLKQDFAKLHTQLQEASSLVDYLNSKSDKQYKFEIKQVTLWHNPAKAKDNSGWEKGFRIVLSFTEESRFAEIIKLENQYGRASLIGGNLFFDPLNPDRYQFTLKTDQDDSNVLSQSYYTNFMPQVCTSSYYNQEDSAVLHEALDFIPSSIK